MAMGFGDSSLSLLSMPTTSPISSSSAPANSVSRSPGCCCRTTVILGGVSRFDSRVPRAGSWRKKFPAISAAESRSVDAAPQSTDGTTTGGSQAQSHLDLLQRMTESSTGSEGVPRVRLDSSFNVTKKGLASPASKKACPHFPSMNDQIEVIELIRGAQVKTIRDQLVSQGGEAEVPLAKLEKDKAVVVPELTISQKRNIRRQNYLNKVSERNDAPFFAIVAATVLVPPILILALAVATGYVELFP